MLQNNVSVTFEVLSTYPEKPPNISISAELTNAERFLFENELRNVAQKSIGYPMIMDLVIKLQQLTEDYYAKKRSERDKGNASVTTEKTGKNYVYILNSTFIYLYLSHC